MDMDEALMSYSKHLCACHLRSLTSAEARDSSGYHTEAETLILGLGGAGISS